MKERIYWIDNVKGIGMLMVIVVHTCLWTTDTEVASLWARTFCMPLFFILSGITKGLFPKDINLKQTIKSRFALLMIPFVIFSIFNSVQKFAGMIVMRTMTMEVLWDEMIQIPLLGNGVVWFLQALFISETLFYVIFTTKKRKYKLVLTALLAFIIPFLIATNNNHILIVLNRTLEAYALIVLGYLMVGLLRIGIHKKIVMGVVLLAIEIITVAKFGYSHQFMYGTFENIWNFIAVGICGSIGTIMLVLSLNVNIPVLTYIGKNSMSYMLVHSTFILMFPYIVLKYVSGMPSYIIQFSAFLVIIFTVVASAVTTELIRKYIPFVLGVRCK